MSSSPEGDLQFSVFRKLGHKLKYVGKEITHTPGTLRAIPSGLVNQHKPIGAMEIFLKPNFNLCMEERSTILKKIRDKHVIIMNNNLEIYGACRHKATFRRFCLSNDDPVFNP